LLASWPLAQALAGALTLMLAINLLWKRRLALMIFAIGGFGLLAFGYTKYLGVMRHHGHFWLLFVAAYWIASEPASEHARRSYRDYLWLAIVCLQAAAMVYASVVDLRYPFSNGARTAQLMRAQGLDKYPLLGYREPPASSIALPLGKPLY